MLKILYHNGRGVSIKLCVVLYVHFFSPSKRNEPKKRRSERERSHRTKANLLPVFDILPSLRTLPSCFPAENGNIFSVAGTTSSTSRLIGIFMITNNKKIGKNRFFIISLN